MKSDHTEGGLLSNLELTGNRLLLDRTLVFWKILRHQKDILKLTDL